MTHRLEIDGWLPATLNQLMGVHWAARNSMKRADRMTVVMFASAVSRVPKAIGPRRVDLELTLPKGRRRPDPDAWWKSTLDALVHAGLLIDDGPKWCVPGAVIYQRGSQRTTITLTDLEDQP